LKEKPLNNLPYSKPTGKMKKKSSDAALADLSHQCPSELSGDIKPASVGSKRRQLAAIVAVNLATFLQGASLPTSSVSSVALLKSEKERDQSAGWPLPHFTLSQSESTFIGGWIRIREELPLPAPALPSAIFLPSSF